MTRSRQNNKNNNNEEKKKYFMDALRARIRQWVQDDDDGEEGDDMHDVTAAVVFRGSRNHRIET